MAVVQVCILFLTVSIGVLGAAPCTQVGRKYPHPVSCRKYIECVEGGQYRVGSCSLVKRFDEGAQGCQWFWKIGCKVAACFEGGRTPIPESALTVHQRNCTRIYFQPPSSPPRRSLPPQHRLALIVATRAKKKKIETEQAPILGLLKPFARDTSPAIVAIGAQECHSFYECKDGALGVRPCPPRTMFDPRSANCTASYDCSLTPECVEGYVRPLEGECKTFLRCSGGRFVLDQCSASDNFNPSQLVCQRGYECHQQCYGIWKRPDPKDCKKYVECSEGKVIHGSCSWLHRFDPVTLECLWRWGVDCSKKPIAWSQQMAGA
ncbi:hypothetical protein AAG570_007391 [Ranatra chinensis]|uniref:Chitin-binding type-2 domain-containing protein n=1 Tax=Ranatra chinensis TaxID=642074 RepID=A0ABD0XVS0_9HEMI